jgi:hypothetical protein
VEHADALMRPLIAMRHRAMRPNNEILTKRDAHSLSPAEVAMLHRDSPTRTVRSTAHPARDRDHTNKWHRETLDVVDQIDRIQSTAACDFLSVIVSSTDDPMLKFKCLDVMHYLRLSGPDDVPQQAAMAMVRLREYCEAVLARQQLSGDAEALDRSTR